ncbi:MAG: cytochrome c [Alphaproteobacteria bacterium]|nr:cytochrome c [Alphaproteobacteria bacterium]
MRRADLVFLALLVPVPATAIELLPGDPDVGRDLAARWCANCHDIAPRRQTSLLAVAPAFQSIAEKPGATVLSLRVYLQSPHGDMPDIMLSPDQTDNLVSYILSLRGS